MIRRAYIKAVMAVGLAALALYTTPSYSKLAASTRTVQRYLHDIKGNGTGNSLSPIERLVFSFVLTENEPAPPCHVVSENPS